MLRGKDNGVIIKAVVRWLKNRCGCILLGIEASLFLTSSSVRLLSLLFGFVQKVTKFVYVRSIGKK